MTIALLEPKPRESLCSKCTGLCCRYVALPIETPKTRGDFDDVRWYLAHEGFSVFVDEGDWYVNIAARCRYLTVDNLCGTYENRPRICRGYKDGNCDYHGGDYGYDLYFSSTEDLAEYVDKKFRKKKTKRKA